MVPGSYLAYGAFVVGVVGGLAFTAWSALLQQCRIDDPTDSSAGLFVCFISFHFIFLNVLC